jgi:hypothetical protein
MSKQEKYSALRRAALRKLALAGALGGGMLALLREVAAATPDGGMRSIKGSVHIDGTPAELGQRILPGQTVTTETGSEAVFVVGTDAFLQRDNSTFRIGSNAGVVVLRYISGKVLSVFGKGRKTLLTPTATIGIRGTACYIEAEQVRTYFCLCYGKALLTPHSDRSRPQTLHTRHHERPLYIHAGTGRSVIESANVVNHVDAELIMLEALVGRMPPFSGKDFPPY